MGTMADEHPGAPSDQAGDLDRGVTARARARKLKANSRTAIQKARWVVINAQDLCGRSSSTRRVSQALRRRK